MIVTFQPLGVGEVSSSIAMGDLLVFDDVADADCHRARAQYPTLFKALTFQNVQ